jgi:glycosyltransferase involved in cell wall biosynthesis
LLIVDNASPIAAKAILQERLPASVGHVTFIRNVGNIGLAANVLRCFEHARGEWVWVLSDDDTPLPAAIKTALDAMESAIPSDVLLKFNSANGGYAAERARVANIEELAIRCRDTGFYSNLLFISSGLFRTEVFRRHLSTGYHWSYSIAPHIAILLTCIVEGATVGIVPFSLVEHGVAEKKDQWNRARVVTGFTSLAEIENSELFARVAMPRIAMHYVGGRFMRSMVRDFFADTGRPSEYWRMHYLRLASVTGGWTGWTVSQLAWMLPNLARLSPLRKALRKYIRPHSALDGLSRS